MARYIDADKLFPWLDVKYRSKYPIGDGEQYGTVLIYEVLDEVDDAETEDVAPVVHAHWDEFSDYTGTCYAECSRCGLLWWIEEGTAEENEMFYCPKCGAKMDGKEGKE